ncbi:fructose-bisphosphate aldolase class-I [Sphaeroforma arctica JP610]|uniref:fructose-bisphosphate aldolase n=1 Tax=Sphaeroforma arctica JP610 TaxID=667725 RepID=A0A0L0FFG4_9EUKA|nr:fructose-bisphosphate aldolase class-I [Sphaeroforma arctica JP610]KNC74783.1 fructose-bisphosphate aldolase class-I [Sphaeroforma arctica JP610]|eukprot:XP_014148685.1 fructose-bisphosphate aldolase class-I [Sphaeroforma arctica JP610]
MQGLDSLAERLRGYYILGARFTKWRAPFTIDAETGRPTAIAIEANMRDLARVALISQAEGMVPIVEPDVVMQGTHDLPTAVAINTQIHATLYKAMLDHGVYMEGCILKTNMVTPGLSYPVSYTKQDIAAACLTVLKRTMPVSIRSCNYLSGGQALHVACARLGAIQALKGNCPWNISFSWSAALQLPLLDLCKGTTLQDALPSMASLYLEELQLACAASKGIIPADFEESIGGHEPKN